MQFNMTVTIASEHELPYLDFGLESILEKTRHEVNCTLFLAKYSDSLHEESAKLAEKFNIAYEPRGDNSLLQYNNEMRHKTFDIDQYDTLLTIQPDTVFLKKNIFDDIVDKASEYFDEKYFICVSSDHPDDSTPLAMAFHTKLGWEKYGCDDINFYPQQGAEHDIHRRCYLAWGLDPENKEKYKAALGGKVQPEWSARIRTPYFFHAGKPWNGDPRLNSPQLMDYAVHYFCNNVLNQRFLYYYYEKWGGALLQEKYLLPFNKEQYSYRIPFERCQNPYPEAKSPTLKGLII